MNEAKCNGVGRFARRNDPDRVRFYDAAGRIIREQRLAAGVSQRALAEVAGVSHSALTQYEAGTCEVPFFVVMRIADHLDLTTDTFAPIQITEAANDE